MSSTTIHWGRILLGGLLAEVALILAIVPLGLRLGDNFLHYTAPPGSFVMCFLGALWVCRRIESHFILHGMLVGVVAALALFAALLFILLRIARRATDPFSSLCVFGIAGMLFTHIVENIGMTINLMPITGIPLPFFSYGGSFLLACSLGVGIALRVAWESRQSGYAEL